MKKVVIIGASVAGHNAAWSVRQKDKDTQVAILTQEAYPFYDRRKLTDCLGGNCTRKELILFKEEDYSRENIVLLKDHKVTSVNTQRKTIHCKDRDIIRYDTLVIATGRSVVLPEVPGWRKPGLFTFSSLQDLQEISQWYIRGAVGILGADEIAQKIGAGLALKYKVEVKLVSSGVSFTGPLPPGVEVVEGALQELIGEGQVQAMKLQSGKVIAVSAVIAAGNFKANTGFLKNTALEMSADCLLVDDTGRTCLEDVFACGTVACARGLIQPLNSWLKAQESGILAGSSITSRETVLPV